MYVLYKIIVIKFFWNITNIIGYNNGKRVVIELLQTILEYYSHICNVNMDEWVPVERDVSRWCRVTGCPQVIGTHLVPRLRCAMTYGSNSTS